MLLLPLLYRQETNSTDEAQGWGCRRALKLGIKAIASSTTTITPCSTSKDHVRGGSRDGDITSLGMGRRGYWVPLVHSFLSSMTPGSSKFRQELGPSPALWGSRMIWPLPLHLLPAFVFLLNFPPYSFLSALSPKLNPLNTKPTPPMGLGPRISTHSCLSGSMTSAPCVWHLIDDI